MSSMNGDIPLRDALDLSAIRARLTQSRGREYWRSLEEAADSPAVQEMLHREFPSQASEWTDPVGRREFLRLMGASLALAGVSACTRQPDERIVPYVRQPEDTVPGRPLFFATAMAMDGYATGVLVESHMGRPTKIEGNPDHPASLGATDIFAQASILSLYDPDRAQAVTYQGEIRPWSQFAAALGSAVRPIRRRRGVGLRILTGPVGSPTLAQQLKELIAGMPMARWYQVSPISRDNLSAGARLAFGEYVETRYHVDNADVIVSLDGDLLGSMPGSLRYSREFATRRNVGQNATPISRLYAIESTPSITGARADHRLPLRASQIEAFARALVVPLVPGAAAPSIPVPDEARRWADVIARDLQQHRGSSLIVAGPAQPPAVHALAHLANDVLGNAGVTVEYSDPFETSTADESGALRELATDMAAGRVTTLIIIGTNPVYTAPADLQFAANMQKVDLRVYMGPEFDETAALSHWHVPETHYLEEWSDARAFDGTISIVQPLVAPLYDGHSPHELVSVMADRPRTSYEIVREHWQRRFADSGAATAPAEAAAPPPAAPNSMPPAAAAATPQVAPAPAAGAPGAGDPGKAAQGGQPANPAFERFWRRALHDGVVPNTASRSRTVTVNAGAVLGAPSAKPVSGIEVLFVPDPTVYDGRFANNAWLQELPKPLTKITWDNAALLSPRTADRLGIRPTIAFRGGEHGQTIAEIVEVQYQGRSLRVPVWVTPGQADDCITLHLGQGRSRVGRVGSGVGANAYALRTLAAPWIGGPADVRVTGDRMSIACTQAHHSMEGRELVRTASLDEYRKAPNFAHHGEEEPPRTLTLYPQTPREGYAWGMTIDLNVCTGCSACVVACQAENNIPVVGKDQVLRAREMHWLRIDRYHSGPLDAPDTHFQPVPCMQCENAPCEVVCPVAATVHSSEGLNDMVYNRCVGTRYCSNNCPYKVRRFNFFLYSDWNTSSLKLVRNPDVSVRSRGVMEKCTYCVQRINGAKIQSEKDGRQVRDGEIATACEAACPTQAIVFGNINDPNSRVSKLKADPRNYGLLAGLNTRPRTTYLAQVRNFNPELA